MNPLTIAYLTARREPKIQWFFDALHRECRGDYNGIRVVVVDFWAVAHKPEDNWTDADACVRRMEFRSLCLCPDMVHSAPIWDTWQGPHRLTRENWFAKCNYLNAAVCLTPGDYMASVDDLSVLMPGWLAAAREATAFDGIMCGAYRKVKNLAVKDGEVTHFEDHPIGHDPRWNFGSSTPTGCRGNRMFGCSFVAPVSAILKINGWPALLSNGHGFEDSCTGLVLERVRTSFRYDRRLLTFESEELHHVGPSMRREDYGKSPNDKSHKFLSICSDDRTRRFEQFGGEGLAGVRARVLAGAPLPVLTEPRFEWFTGTRLQDL